jgi:hypothetical protein
VRPLDGARFKLIRAEEHVDALHTAIDDWLDRKPFLTTVEVDEETWDFALSIDVREAANPYWGSWSEISYITCAPPSTT